MLLRFLYSQSVFIILSFTVSPCTRVVLSCSVSYRFFFVISVVKQKQKTKNNGRQLNNESSDKSAQSAGRRENIENLAGVLILNKKSYYCSLWLSTGLPRRGPLLPDLTAASLSGRAATVARARSDRSADTPPPLPDGGRRRGDRRRRITTGRTGNRFPETNDRFSHLCIFTFFFFLHHYYYYYYNARCCRRA